MPEILAGFFYIEHPVSPTEHKQNKTKAQNAWFAGFKSLLMAPFPFGLI